MWGGHARLTTSRGRVARLSADGSGGRLGKATGSNTRCRPSTPPSRTGRLGGHHAAWMRYVWREVRSRFLQFALDVFDIEPIDDRAEAWKTAVTAGAVDELQAFFVDMGMPKTMGELGLHEQDIDAVVETLRATKATTFGAFQPLTMDDAKAINLSAFADPALPSLEEAGAKTASSRGRNRTNGYTADPERRPAVSLREGFPRAACRGAYAGRWRRTPEKCFHLFLILLTW